MVSCAAGWARARTPEPQGEVGDCFVAVDAMVWTLKVLSALKLYLFSKGEALMPVLQRV